MQKKLFKKSDLFTICGLTVGITFSFIKRRMTLPEDQLPPIAFHVGSDILILMLWVLAIAAYRKFWPRASLARKEEVREQSIWTTRDFFMVSELPAWAQKTIQDSRGKEGAISNVSYGNNHLSILDGLYIIFNGKRVYENMEEVGPETTINFTDLPKEVQKKIRLAGRKESVSIMTSEERLLINNGRVYFDKKLVINIH